MLVLLCAVMLYAGCRRWPWWTAIVAYPVAFGLEVLRDMPVTAATGSALLMGSLVFYALGRAINYGWHRAVIQAETHRRARAP